MRARTAFALAAAVGWAVAVPYAADAAGLRLGVESRQEVVDHVLPAVVACAGLLLLAAVPGAAAGITGASLVLLAGLFVTGAHLPLLPQMLDGPAPAGPALLHLSAGLPLAWLGARLVLARLP